MPNYCENCGAIETPTWRRVVLKESRGSAEFERLGFDRVEGGRHSEVAYGVLEIC